MPPLADGAGDPGRWWERALLRIFLATAWRLGIPCPARSAMTASPDFQDLSTADRPSTSADLVTAVFEG